MLSVMPFASQAHHVASVSFPAVVLAARSLGGWTSLLEEEDSYSNKESLPYFRKL